MTDPGKTSPDNHHAGAAVVIGRSHDGPATAEFAYGPYHDQIAAQVARDLNAGDWHHMKWVVIRLTTFPAGPRK